MLVCPLSHASLPQGTPPPPPQVIDFPSAFDIAEWIETMVVFSREVSLAIGFK